VRAAVEAVSRLVELPGRNKWECDGCGKLDFWTDEHQWYGSYRDIDGDPKFRSRPSGPEQIVVTCSEACRREVVAKGLVPP
jgi:hypothetical protein